MIILRFLILAVLGTFMALELIKASEEKSLVNLLVAVVYLVLAMLVGYTG